MSHRRPPTGSASSLEGLSFGQDVAEYDDELAKYFLRTGAFWALTNDQVDLVLGAKGTGKSAIARFLTIDTAEIASIDDVIVLPAFNVRGSVLFRRLEEQFPGEDESVYRDIFFAYLLGLASNNIVQNFAHATDTSALSKALARSGLLVAEPTAQSVWRRVLGKFRPKIQTTIGVTESGLTTITGSATFSEPPTDTPAALTAIPNFEELETLLQLASDVLAALDCRYWLILDRLDEAFTDRNDVEVPALRGLLRAHLDICSIGNRIRPKLFLRQDLFDRITRDHHFTNATHLRSIRLTWDADTIVQLLALRIKWTSTNSSQPSITHIARASARKLCRKVLPVKVERTDALIWLLLVTADGSRQYSPRNVLTLLRHAHIEQMQIALRSGTNPRGAPARLSIKALRAGYEQLSAARLQDTLYAESLDARALIEKLYGRDVRFTRRALSTRLETTGKELDEALQILRYVGFLRFDGEQYIIPPLYRPAMFAGLHGSERHLGTTSADCVNTLTVQQTDIHPNQVEYPTRQRIRGHRSRSREPRDQIVPTSQRSEVEHEDDLKDKLVGELGPPVPRTTQASADSDPPSPTRPLQAEIIKNARNISRSSNPLNAFLYLHPEHTGEVRVACTAADLAYRSGDTNIKQQAIHLLSQSDIRLGRVLGRAIVLQQSLSNSAELGRLLELVNIENLHEVFIAVIRIIDRTPSVEIDFWRDSLAMNDSALDSRSILKTHWPLLAGSRILAIVRGSNERMRDTEVNVEILRDQLQHEHKWDEISLTKFMTTYSEDPSSTVPPMLSYQVLSIFALLESLTPVKPTMRRGVIHSLCRETSKLDESHWRRFIEWERYSSLVSDVMKIMR